MSDYILSIDPGLSTGIALLGYDESSVWLEEAWQFSGGVSGLIGWHDNHTYEYIEGCVVFTVNPDRDYGQPVEGSRVLGSFSSTWTNHVTVIAEKFTARNTRGFSYTTASLEPLRGEGALIALGLMPDYDSKEKRWMDPVLQYLVGGKDKADKKKRQHAFLRDSGFYRTGGDLGTPDADDFRSAAAHGLAYLTREVKHKPTFDLVSNWANERG